MRMGVSEPSPSILSFPSFNGLAKHHFCQHNWIRVKMAYCARSVCVHYVRKVKKSVCVVVHCSLYDTVCQWFVYFVCVWMKIWAMVALACDSHWQIKTIARHSRHSFLLRASNGHAQPMSMSNFFFFFFFFYFPSSPSPIWPFSFFSCFPPRAFSFPPSCCTNST